MKTRTKPVLTLPTTVPTMEETLSAQEARRRLIFDLSSFIRFRHKLGSQWVAMSENWSAVGPDEVWHVFIHDGVEHRFSGPMSDFKDWQAAR